MIFCTPPIQGRILIVPQKFQKPWGSCTKITLNPKNNFLSEIIISPCRSENYVSGLLFKLKIICELMNIKLITVGNRNYFPFYSMYSDEVILTGSNSKQSWYHDNGDGSRNNIEIENIINLPNFIELDWEDMEIYKATIPYKKQKLNHLKKLAETVSDELVAERFANWECYILEDSYNKYLQIQNDLPRDVVIAEIKKESVLNDKVSGIHRLIDFGLDREFQRNLILKTSVDHYLTTQLLASCFLNWQYFCCGGAINLFCVVPIKVLGAIDIYMNESTIREISKLRYGLIGNSLPVMSKVWAWDQSVTNFFHQNLDKMIKGIEYLSLIKHPEISYMITK